MKNILFIFMLFLSNMAIAQPFWEINFESGWDSNKIVIDTLNQSLNRWSIGKPQKNVFTSAYSEPNAIMTDTLNALRPNDTSVFCLFHERDNTAPFHIFYLRFWFQMDGDSTDYGSIEISPDKGLHWIDILKQDTTYNIQWRAEKPTLYGSTNGWTEFYITMEDWATYDYDYPIPMTADSIIFKFTYITDSNATSHDGWIIDNIQVEDFWESIYELKRNDLLTVFPNPVSQTLNFNLPVNNPNGLLQIISTDGRLQMEKEIKTSEPIQVATLKKGLYILVFTNPKQQKWVGKFIKD